MEALDFEWGDMSVHQRYRFVPLVMGLRVFRHLNGYATPDYDYVGKFTHSPPFFRSFTC